MNPKAAAGFVERAAALRRSSSARTGSRSAAWLGKNFVTTLQPLHVRQMLSTSAALRSHLGCKEFGMFAERTLAEHYDYVPASCLQFLEVWARIRTCTAARRLTGWWRRPTAGG